MHLPITIKAHIGGEFRLVKKNMETGEVTKTPWQKNLVTDYGLTALFATDNSNYWGTACGVGTGNTTPTIADTSLAAMFAEIQNNSSIATRSAVGTPDYFNSNRVDYTFPQGTFNGTILSEIGLTAQNAPNLGNNINYVTRALIDPAITGLAIEELTVQYTMNLYVPQTTNSGTINVGGGPSNVGWSINAANAGSINFANEYWPARNMAYTGGPRYDYVRDYTGCTALGGIEDTQPTNGSVGDLVKSVVYSNQGLGTARATWVVGTDDFNDVTGFNGMDIAMQCGTFKMFLDTPIPKDNTQTFTIAVDIQVVRH